MAGSGPRPVVGDEDLPTLRVRDIHGYRRAYRVAGEGPAILLLHGIGDSSATWRQVMPELARTHRVIAPDLLGHGASAKPRGDYSVGGFANGVRDLLSVLGTDRVTIVGHSLGAGVAMQFAYQYPERCERLVLVSAGGVTRDIHLAFRALSLPGTALALGALRLPTVRRQIGLVAGLLHRLDTGVGLDVADVLRILDGLPDAEARSAFVRTLRSVVDVRGQVVTMLDRCYLLQGTPTLFVWGSRDGLVPAQHGRIARTALPWSRLEVFEGAGHFPFRSDVRRFVELLTGFIEDTRPAEWDAEGWRRSLRAGSLPDLRFDAAEVVSEGG